MSASFRDSVRYRSSELREYGQNLKKLLDRCSDVFLNDFESMDFSAQSILISSLLSKGEEDSEIGMALNLLCSKCVIQISSDKMDLFILFDQIIRKQSNYGVLPTLVNERRDKPFRIKKPDKEGKKTNVWFSDVWESLKINNKHDWLRFLERSSLMHNLTNDQATACVLASEALSRFDCDNVMMSIRMLLDPDGCKILNTVIKSLGLNGTDLGSILCEAVCLQGMPEMKMDLKRNCMDRCDSAMSIDTITFDEQNFRSVVRSIYRDEIDLTKYDPDGCDDKWMSRWLWTTNGGHSNALKRIDNRWLIDCNERMFRKSVMENVDDNMLNNWRGSSIISASIKPEIGKPGRPLMAVDTHTYANFELLLKPVEKCWRNRRTLLNPGGVGQFDVVNRVREMKGGINVMLDYDKFDMQHSIKAQQIVIEELCTFLGYDDERKKDLSKSFERQLIMCNGERIGLSKFSLMTGHRGTTFINSVLNTAYIRTSLGDRWHKTKSLHTGDDVYACFESTTDVDLILDGNKRMNVKMNAMKQSVGVVCSEFLRIAVMKSHATGYLMRSIGRIVSGNWEVDEVLDPSKSLIVWLSSARTLLNRSRSDRVVRLLVKSMNRSTRVAFTRCKELLMGEKAIEGGPVFGRRPVWRGYKVLLCNKDAKKKHEITLRDDYKSYATEDYLSNCVTEIERSVMERLNISVKRDMLTASYAKNQHVRDQLMTDSEIILMPLKDTLMTRTASMETVSNYKRAEDFAVLLKYPILALLKDRIPVFLIKQILQELGFENLGNIRRLAWGESDHGNVIDGILSYSDASSLCGVLDRTTIHTTFPIFV